MKLAEALRERADLQHEIAQLQHRIGSCARYLEGEQPEEDAAALLDRARDVLARHEKLVARINRTNAVTLLPSGPTITAAMAHRAYLNGLRNFLSRAADDGAGAASDRVWGRRRASELKETTAIPVSALRDESDHIAAELRVLDVQIQQVNWSTDLL